MMATEKRLIDANETITAFTNWLTSRYDGRMPRDIVAEIPTVDAVEVVHGRWKSTGDPVLDNIYGVAVCSICGYEYAGNNTNYCPNCGADMRGDGNG
jgi:rubrerythrin